MDCMLYYWLGVYIIYWLGVYIIYWLGYALYIDWVYTLMGYTLYIDWSMHYILTGCLHYILTGDHIHYINIQESKIYYRPLSAITECIYYLWRFSLEEGIEFDVYLLLCIVGNAMSVVLTTILQDYCKDTDHTYLTTCQGISLSRTNFVQILITVECIIILPTLIVYLGKETWLL